MRYPFDAIIFDIDGTLSNVMHRVKYVDGSQEKDWDKFYDLCGDDLPNGPIVELFQLLFEGAIRLDYPMNTRLLFMTGRRESCRTATREWLGQYLDYLVTDNQLMMRENGCHRPDTEIKMEMAEKAGLLGKNVLVIDDRASVTQMWRDLGFTCLQVAKGEF